MRSILAFVLAAAGLFGQRVRVEFNPYDPAVGPFPSDLLTVADDRQKTGLRVNLPTGGCARGGDCEEIALLNELDGFHLAPRITVKFSGPVNIDTLRDGIYLVWMETAWPRPYPLAPEGRLMPVNQLQWDPATNTAYVRPDEILEQGRRYAVVVTDGVKDWYGQSVVADEGFDACLARTVGGDYCAAMSRAAARAAGAKVVGGAVFTTLSATAWLETVYGANALRAVTVSAGNAVALNQVGRIVWRQETSVLPGAPLTDFVFPMTGAELAAAGVGRIAYGTLASPRYLDATGVITGTQQLGTESIAFHVWLPAAPAPAGGYPVVLAAHGLGDSRFGMPSLMGLTLAARGFAVVAINAVGHGYGPNSVLRLERTAGALDIPAPGRAAPTVTGYDALGGCVLMGPGAPFAIRDCMRQTAVDYFTLVRAIRNGIDLDGDGTADLSRSNISLFAQSLGSYYGSLVTAVDPAVGSAVLNAGGGSAMEALRKGASYRILATAYLLIRNPSLATLTGDFDEQYPDRYREVIVLDKPNAAAIGMVMDRLDWLQASGSPLSYAPYFFSATPAGSPLKRILMQAAIGDQTVPNSASSQLMRSANLVQNTSIYRHDVAAQLAAELPANPHTYLAWLIETPAQKAISNAALTQAALFLSGTDGVPDVNSLVRPLFGRDLFEIPAIPPEAQNFVKR